VCVVCRNEAAKLEDCLASVGWADEVLVMDLDSSDGSAAVAARFGARVVPRAPHPIVEPLRNELAALAAGPWVLALDPDERVTPGLASALREQAGRDEIDAVVVPRMNIDFGWPPRSPLQRYEPQLRFYRSDRVRWPEFPNALPSVPEARLARIPGDDDHVLEHHRNVCVAETAERLVRYAPAEAQAMFERGDVFSAAAMSAALRSTAYRHFLTAKPWEEGLPGLVRALVLLNHKVYVWIAFWQLSGGARTPEDDAYVARLGRVLRLVDRARHLSGTARRARDRLRGLLRA
jgi:glycosyltransferase involved in cell wall biosynthesis